jgi:hypothetical protein
LRAPIRKLVACAGAVAVVTVAASCSAILGLGDPAPYDDAGPGATSGGPAAEGGSEAAPAQTCDADLVTDPKNCGACGHDCRGAACEARRCAPILVATLATTATGQGSLADFAVDSAALYTFDGRALVRIPKDGSASKTLFGGSAPEAPLPAGGPHVSRGFVFWADLGSPGTVRACPTSGCTAAISVATGVVPYSITELEIPGSPWWIAWTDGRGGGSVGYVQADGGAGVRATIVGLGESLCREISAANGIGYVPDRAMNRLVAVSPTAFARTALSVSNPCRVVARGDHVYFSDDLNVWSARREASVLAPPIQIANGQQGVSALAADDTHVYWSTRRATVLRCALPKCSGDPEVVVPGLSEPTRTIALDGEWIYFNLPGPFNRPRIWKVAR